MAPPPPPRASEAPSNIIPGQRGLFTVQQLPPGEAILVSPTPLLTIADSAHLEDTCSNCFTWAPRSTVDTPVRTLSSDSATPALKRCSKCQLERYCSEQCQRQAWKRHHKYECPIFTTLRPRVLPTTARALVRLLLLRRYNILTDSQWAALSALRSHQDDFSSKLTAAKWQELHLTCMAAHKYSGTDMPVPFTLDLFCKILINSMTLVTPTFDPVGVCLDPTAASVNHSCDPNAVVVFDGPQLSLRSLREIGKGEEVTISYVDCTSPFEIRQLELVERYFFACACGKCRQGAAADLKELSWDQHPGEHLSPESNEMETSLQPWPQRSQQTWPATQQRQAITSLTNGHWKTSLAQHLRIYFSIDPLLFREPWHPVRVVHRWTLTLLLLHVASLSAENASVVAPLRRYALDYGRVVWALLREVEAHTERSHGAESRFAGWVKSKAREVGEDMARGGRDVRGLLEEKALEVEWTKLRAVAEMAVDYVDVV